MKSYNRRITRKTILLLTLILSLSTTWLSGFASVNPIELNQDFLKYKLRAPYVANFTHTIQIQNFGTSKATDVQLYVPLVQNQTARYFVIINEISPTPQQFLEDNGNVYAYWNIETIPAAHSFTVNINYHILAFNVAFLVNPSLVGPYDESSAIYREHTIPEHLIESNNTLIVSTAQNVVGEETNPQEMALRIYEFVVDRLTYEVQPEEQGALWALQNRRGDCSEYSYLFVALSRTYNDDAQLESYQTLQTLRASTEILDKFPFLQAVYDAISEIRSAEVTIEVAEVTGTQLLWNNRLTEAKEILEEADIYLQKAMEAWSNQSDSAIGYAQIARERAEQIQRLLNNVMLETMILIIVIPLMGVAVIFVLLVRRGRSMRENVLVDS